MSLSQMRTTTASVRPLIYDDTKYCMHSAVRENDLDFCRKIPNADLNERVAQILWQVVRRFKISNPFPGRKSQRRTAALPRQWHASGKWYMDWFPGCDTKG